MSPWIGGVFPLRFGPSRLSSVLLPLLLLVFALSRRVASQSTALVNGSCPGFSYGAYDGLCYTCVGGTFCVGGVYGLCPGGSYCPSMLDNSAWLNGTANQTVVDCPVGYVCSQGSVSPEACSFANIVCTEPSLSKPMQVPLIIATLLVLALAIIILYFITFILRRMKRIRDAKLQLWYAAVQSKRKEFMAVRPFAFRWLFYTRLNKRMRDDNLCECAVDSVCKRCQSKTAAGDTLRNKEVIRTLVQSMVPSRIKLQYLDRVAKPVNIDFKDVCVSLQSDGRHVLNHISGTIPAGKVTGIMGPSGCGKSTLLSVVRGFSDLEVSGRVLVNGERVSSLSVIREQGYVPQNDVMCEDMTVGENIELSQRMFSFAKNVSRENERALVDELCEHLNLAHIRSSFIGNAEVRGISGGERKRCSIAMEVVKQPRLLVLDEPTTGLDSTSSFDLMRNLGDLANMGMTILCTIHQPRIEVFHKLDFVILLAPGGYVAYAGAMSRVHDYFSSIDYEVRSNRTNYADFLMDVVQGQVRRTFENRLALSKSETGEYLQERWQVRFRYLSNKKRTVQSFKALKKQKGTIPPNKFLQFWLQNVYDPAFRLLVQTGCVVYRTTLQLHRKMHILVFQILIAWIAGVIVAAISSGAIGLTIFTMLGPFLIFGGIIGVMLSASILTDYIDVRIRESEAGLSRTAYSVGNMLAALTIMVPPSCVYAVTVWCFMSPYMPISDMIVNVICLLWTSTGFTMLLTSFFSPKGPMGYSIFLTFVLWIFAGINPVSSEMYLTAGGVGVFFQTVSYFPYAAAIFLSSEWLALNSAFNPYLYSLSATYGVQDSSTTLTSQAIYSKAIVNLVVYGLVCRILVWAIFVLGPKVKHLAEVQWCPGQNLSAPSLTRELSVTSKMDRLNVDVEKSSREAALKVRRIARRPPSDNEV